MIGGTGVLSTAITQEALKQGMEVYMINRGNRMNLIPQKVHLLKADVKDKAKVLSLLKNHFFDAVIDFICFTEKELEYSFNLFKDKAKQYIFISSCAVYNNMEYSLFDEDAPQINPVWKYSIDKNKSEQLLIKMAQESNTNYTIVRPGVTYGNTRIPYGITPPYGYHWTIIGRILNGKPIITWNKGGNFHNLTHVDDFAVGVIGLLNNEKAFNEAFNVVGDETPTEKEVLDVLSKLLNKEVKVFDISPEYYAQEIPSRKGEILGGRACNAKISNQKLKSIVPEFKQSISLKEGIKRTLDYYKSNNYIYGIDYAFDADTDRIIAKYAKENNISTEGLNLYFIDYLKENKFKNKWIYTTSYNKDNYFGKLFLLSTKIWKKAIKLLK
ncbi:MAG: NAD-dependent epimerase/dehydratase family protein [Bacteroidetes bacterium]|nr:NAD-dependent epimerase/dehydratase family protein [Bacteroidota bacterium]